jgi:hypothetical protein
MLKRSRETESFTVSFLDVASCGFGAMIILLMLAKPSQPSPFEDAEAAPAAVIRSCRSSFSRFGARRAWSIASSTPSKSSFRL